MGIPGKVVPNSAFHASNRLSQSLGRVFFCLTVNAGKETDRPFSALLRRANSENQAAWMSYGFLVEGTGR